MTPSYYPGDHVLTFNWIIPKENDVIVFRKENQLFIKRIIKMKERKYNCRGVNKKDSKIDYQVLSEDVVGKIVFKY